MEDYNGIIDFLFQKKDEEGLIEYRSPEADRHYKETQKNFKNLMRFINKEIPQPKRGKLIHLFKLFNSSAEDSRQTENALCYKGGFGDGIMTIYEILPSEIKEAE